MNTALISKECAWRRLLEIAEETKTAMDYSFDEEEWDRDTVRLYDDYDGIYEFTVRSYLLDGDVLEDAETFMDLRTLASLCVVVGPDALCGKMFSAVVALRETKMPRTLYVKAPTHIGISSNSPALRCRRAWPPSKADFPR